jgi:hypothetical protein
MAIVCWGFQVLFLILFINKYIRGGDYFGNGGGGGGSGNAAVPNKEKKPRSKKAD